MKVHYAVQICDIANNQTNIRYHGGDRTSLSIKSIQSLINAVHFVSDQVPVVEHHILFVDDHSSIELKQFLNKVKNQNDSLNIIIQIVETQEQGLMSTVRTCYEWLRDNGTDLVYQIQDDYVFDRTSIMEMIDVFFQMKGECGTDIVISPFNDPWLWLGPYRNKTTPRTVIAGKRRYWISFYDTSCSFMTSAYVLKSNWDLLDQFCNMPPLGIDGDLENVTLNKMFTERGILGLVPITSLALHVQSDLEKDPYIDWKQWWDSV